MVQNSQVKAMEAVVSACRDLIKTANRPEAVPIDDFQVEVEWLLDAVKTAKLQGCDYVILGKNISPRQV